MAFKVAGFMLHVVPDGTAAYPNENCDYYLNYITGRFPNQRTCIYGSFDDLSFLSLTTAFRASFYRVCTYMY